MDAVILNASDAPSADDVTQALFGDETGAPPMEETPAPVEAAAPITPTIQPQAQAPVVLDEPDELTPPEDVVPKQPDAAPVTQTPVVDEPVEPEPPAIQSQPKEVREAFAKSRNEARDLKRERREIKAEKDAIAAKLQQLESELTAVKTQAPKELMQVAELQKKLEETQELLGKHDVRETQWFKETYDAPLKSTFDMGVKALSAGSGHSPEDAGKIMRQLARPDVTREEVQEILSNEPPHVQSLVFSKYLELTEARSRREGAITNWKETKAAAKDKEGRDGDVRGILDVVKATEGAAMQLLKEGNPLYARSSTDAKWNEAVDARMRTVQGILRSGKTDELAKYIADGVTSREFRMAHAKLRSENLKLKSEIAQLTSATPRVKLAVGPGVDAPQPKPVQVTGDHEDVIGGWFSDAPSGIR